MTAPTYAVMAAILAAPLLLAAAPAEAFTARQATAQGQGVFVTSTGMPQNFVSTAALPQQADNTQRRPLKSLEHHDRYFANY